MVLSFKKEINTTEYSNKLNLDKIFDLSEVYDKILTYYLNNQFRKHNNSTSYFTHEFNITMPNKKTFSVGKLKFKIEHNKSFEDNLKRIFAQIDMKKRSTTFVSVDDQFIFFANNNDNKVNNMELLNQNAFNDWAFSNNLNPTNSKITITRNTISKP